MQCGIYQTIKARDGLIFALFGLSVEGRYALTLLRQSGWENL